MSKGTVELGMWGGDCNGRGDEPDVVATAMKRAAGLPTSPASLEPAR